MARLIVLTPGLAGLAHELGAGWITIGRVDGNAFKLSETSVSSQHCEVRVRGDELEVRDLCSTNGTYFQGRRISEAVLKAGQVLRLGEVELRFEAEAVGGLPAATFTNTMLVGTKQPQPGAPPGSEPTKPAKPAGPSARRHQVLFVDDSLAFLETFTELCGALADGSWDIQTAASADQALALLQRTNFNLVVLDVVMPMVDGIQVLGLIKRRHPGVKIAVLTGRATETNRAACLAGGAELFMEKPVSPEGCKVVFNLLKELVSWEGREGFSGALHQVGLQEVIQMECIGRRSLILEVRNEQMLGEIYIEVGAIIHASVGDLTGARAFNRLLSLTGGEFRLKPFEPPSQRTVQESWECLVMEAARCRDEETDLVERQAAKSDTTLKLVIREMPSTTGPDFTKPDEEFVVVATYDGEWSPVEAAKP